MEQKQHAPDDTIFFGLTDVELEKLRLSGVVGYRKEESGLPFHVLICYGADSEKLAAKMTEQGATRPIERPASPVTPQPKDWPDEVLLCAMAGPEPRDMAILGIVSGQMIELERRRPTHRGDSTSQPLTGRLKSLGYTRISVEHKGDVERWKKGATNAVTDAGRQP